MKTDAWSEFAMLIAMHNLASYYQDALQVLRDNQQMIMFPVQRFKWHAASALIIAVAGDRVAAKEHAIGARDAATSTHSGFRYHSKLGLVGLQYETVRDRLRVLAGAFC